MYSEYLGVAVWAWDDWVRADSSSLGAAAYFQFRTWNEFAGNIAISGNKVVSTAAGGTWSRARLHSGIILDPPKHFTEQKFTISAEGDGAAVGVKKARDSVLTFYEAQWVIEGGVSIVRIVKYVAGIATTLAAVANGAPGQTRRLQCSVKWNGSANVVTALVNEVQVAQVTDADAALPSTYGDVPCFALRNGGLGYLFTAGHFADDFTEPPGATYESGTRTAGVRPFHKWSVWTRPIGSGATFASVASLMGTALQDSNPGFNVIRWSIPVYLASAGDPLGGLYCNSPSYGGYRELFRVRIPAGAAPNPTADADLMIVDENERFAYILGGSGTVAYLDGFHSPNVKRIELEDSGRYWSFHAAEESGQPIISLLIRQGEAVGVIRHPLTAIGNVEYLMNDKIWPANSVGTFATYDPASNVRMGTLLALNVLPTTLGITSAPALAIAWALYNYGVYINTKGSSPNITFMVEKDAVNDAAWGDAAFRAEVKKATSQLKVISNNSMSAVGGGGTPRTTLAAPFASDVGSVPAAPTGLSVGSATTTTLTATWTDVATDETSYEVEYQVQGAGSWITATGLAANLQIYVATNLLTATIYDFRVRCRNAVGPSAYSATASGTTATAVPTAPSGLGSSAITDTGGTLTWTDNATDETAYEVQHKRSVDPDYTAMTGLTANLVTYQLTGLTASTSYDTRVRCSNSGGDSGFSAVHTFSTAAPPQPPNAPSNCAIVDVSPTTVRVTWVDQSTDETGFKIEIRIDAGSFNQITVTAPGVILYDHVDPAAGAGNHLYQARVRATNAVGDSGYSTSGEVRTPTESMSEATFPSSLAFPGSPAFPSNPTFPS